MTRRGAVGTPASWSRNRAQAKARLRGLAAATLLATSALAFGGLVLAQPAAAAGPVPSVAPPAAAPRVVWHGSRDRRVVALTFDDGYAPWNGRKILGILVDEHVTATFFVNGIYIRRDPDLWRSIAAAGFSIGNHTYLHPDITKLSAQHLLAELLETRREVERVTGRPMAPVFRPPYGARNATSDRLVASAGYAATVMWDTSAGDATRTPNAAASVRAATRGRNGSIVLFHAGPNVTPRILRQVIRAYRARGFTFVTVSELLDLPATMPALLPGPPTIASPGSCPPRWPGGECDPLEAAEPPAIPPGDDVPAAPELLAPPPARTPEPVAQPARAAAWARSDGAEAGVAGLTVALVGGLVVVGALLGRRGRREPASP